VLETELSNGLASLLLVSAVNSDGGASRDGSLALAGALLVVGVGRVRSVIGSGLFCGLVVRELFNTRVRHFDGVCGRCRGAAGKESVNDLRSAPHNSLRRFATRASAHATLLLGKHLLILEGASEEYC
jgi:hypothetical protein